MQWLYKDDYHHDYSFDAICKSLVAAFLPVVCARGLLTKHHGRTMAEKVDWRKCYSVSVRACLSQIEAEYPRIAVCWLE